MFGLATSVAFVDLETTGTRAVRDRITEVGIVRVAPDADPSGAVVTEWSSLIDPEVRIPTAIQSLTGITEAMIRNAPTFSSVARDIYARLADCVFVAHNARFDFSFLKHAFARSGLAFSPRVLCTVRLSRRLYPGADAHNLDALIERHQLPIERRHRALGDARAILAFVEMLYREWPAAVVDTAAKRLLRMPSLPPQLPADTLEHIPDTPGVYLFYGENPLPLYIGKSVHLRDRVASHFAGDWRSETDLRLSQEIRRVEYEETAGELGALLREAILIKTRLPAHNRALRRKSEAGVLVLRADGTPLFVESAMLDGGRLEGGYGPFASRASARVLLREIAREHRLCGRSLGLERRASGPCFARQLKRCAGACVGDESLEAHAMRLRAALGRHAIPAWPIDGCGLVREASDSSARIEVHVLRDWHWLGTAHDAGELGRLLETPPRPAFDLDVTRLLLRRYAAGSLGLVAASEARIE